MQTQHRLSNGDEARSTWPYWVLKANNARMYFNRKVGNKIKCNSRGQNKTKQKNKQKTRKKEKISTPIYADAVKTLLFI